VAGVLNVLRTHSQPCHSDHSPYLGNSGFQTLTPISAQPAQIVTLDAVREAQGAGVEPWNTAEHDKAVHGPTPEGGTTNPMESEPPVSETYDDEGDDERDENASADDEMAFIDDEFFELPDVATEEGAEGGGSQSQYNQQSQYSQQSQDRGGRERREPEQPGQPEYCEKSKTRTPQPPRGPTVHGPTEARAASRAQRG